MSPAPPSKPTAAGANRDCKFFLTVAGPVEIAVPRDRESSFEPKIVAKRQRRLAGIDDLVIALSAKGFTTGEISAHLAEIYGAEVSKQTISTITDRVMEGMSEWQNRPLDPYWLRVLTEIKNRGVADCCIVVCDGLKGLPAAVGQVWPQTIVQTCIVHLLRNSFRYASKKDWSAIAKDLKPV